MRLNKFQPGKSIHPLVAAAYSAGVMSTPVTPCKPSMTRCRSRQPSQISKPNKTTTTTAFSSTMNKTPSPSIARYEPKRLRPKCSSIPNINPASGIAQRQPPRIVANNPKPSPVIAV